MAKHCIFVCTLYIFRDAFLVVGLIHVQPSVLSVEIPRLTGQTGKSKAIQITAHYNRGEQKSISEHVTCQTSRLMGYKNWRAGSTPVSQEQVSEATMGKDSPLLVDEEWKK